MESPRSILNQVRSQYEKYPYPRFSWLAGAPRSSLIHASFETGAALVRQRVETHAKRQILLLGCGTFEPYALGKLHPLATVTAVDLSERTLKIARLRCKIRWVRKINFVRDDLVHFCQKHQNRFDYIHAYGVLHHLADPHEGLRSLARALTPDGFARIMVYSRSSRRMNQILQRAVKLLGMSSPSAQNIKEAEKFIELLPSDHPLKLAVLLNKDTRTESGFVDAVLHARETSFTYDDLRQTLASTGLHIHGWDFSETAHGFLQQAPGTTIDQKLLWLEAFDQWPLPYIFWVSKHKPRNPGANHFIIHPDLAAGLTSKTLPSTLLRRKIALTPLHRKLLKAAQGGPMAEKDIKSLIGDHNDGRQILNELINARFLLGVRP